MAKGNFPTIKAILANRISFAIQNMKQNLLEKDERGFNSVASRVLLQSIDLNFQVFGSRIEANIVMEDYWKAVDEGTKPGTMPDVQKILRWMQHKRIVPAQARKRIPQIKAFSITGRLKRKLKVKAFKDRRLALAEKIANAIKRKGTIKRFGYKGSEFMTSYLDWTFEERLREDISKAIGQDITISILKAAQ